MAVYSEADHAPTYLYGPLLSPVAHLADITSCISHYFPALLCTRVNIHPLPVLVCLPPTFNHLANTARSPLDYLSMTDDKPDLIIEQVKHVHNPSNFHHPHNPNPRHIHQHTTVNPAATIILSGVTRPLS